MAKPASVYGDVTTSHPEGLAKRLADYLLPILLVSVAGAFQFYLAPAIPSSFALLILILVVFLSARVGGIGPGLLGTLLGATLEWTLSPTAGAPAIILFAGIGIIVSLSMFPLRLAVSRAIREHHRKVLDALPQFTCILTLDGIVEEVNRAALEGAMTSRLDVVGKPFHKSYWVSYSGELEEKAQVALRMCREGKPAQFEWKLRYGPDRFVPVEISFSCQGGLVIVSARDISERIASQRESEALREGLERSETIVRFSQKTADLAVFDWLVQTNEITFSEALREAFGLRHDDPEPDDWREIVDPEDRSSLDSEIRRLLSHSEREFRIEFRVKTPSGVVKWVRMAGAIMYLPDKRQRMLGVVADLTHYRRLEAAAVESERRYQLLVANLPEMVFTAFPDGRWNYVSPVWARYTGLAASDTADYGWTRALHPDDVQNVLYRWMDAVQAGKPFVSENRIRSATGEYRWFLLRGAPARDENQRLLLWFGAATDIEDQKRLENTGRAREQWRRRTDESSATGSFEWEPATTRLRCSDEWLRLHRIQPSPTLVLENWIDSIHSDDREIVREKLRKCCVESGRSDFEYRIGGADAHWINTRAKAYVDDEGRPVRVMGVSMDMSERKDREAALRSKQRLESIGTLAGGIAHDFNNLLVGIMGNSGLLLERLATVTPWIQDILRASERAADLTRQMLAFAGKGRFQVEPLNLSGLAKRVASSHEGSLPKNIRIELDIAPDLPPVDADPNQISLALTTLINNAVEAIGNARGAISITTSVRQVDSESLDIPPGTYVALEVRDTGCGMDEPTRARVFDPFFTTKFPGRGLGLAATLGIVRGHKGEIEVTSVPGQGSSFRVLLPASSEATVAEPISTQSEAVEPTGKILVMDDEEVVRNVAKAALERYGYSVLLAEDGEKGVAQFALNPNEILLVLLDFAMPGLSSEETLRRLRAIRPDVKALLFSGYSAEDALPGFEGEGLAGFLQKPFTAQVLVEKVKAAISFPNGGRANGVIMPPHNDVAHNHYPA